MSENAGAHKTFDELLALRGCVAASGQAQLATWAPRIALDTYRSSALNLAHYLTLRRNDLRELQERLMVLGVSSLGRCESRVLPNLDAALVSLAARAGVTRPDGIDPPDADTFFAGHAALQHHTASLFGPVEPDRGVHIMVTMAPEMAEDYEAVAALVHAGMRVARINCSKDDPETWRAIVANVRRAGRMLDVPAKVHFDLCGPRSRTGEVWAREKRRATRGDRILLTSHAVAPNEEYDFVVHSSLIEATHQLEDGAVVTIDEGALRAIVEERLDGARALRVVETRPRGQRIKANKGLNFPGSTLELDPLTEKDRRDLDVITPLADIIGYSFVQTADDVIRLHEELRARGSGPESLGIIAKIETGAAVANLPEIVVQGAGAGPFGVMIARGDLAVEIGYRRLAEIQEELLWLCEAAHVPIIWATEVLSSTVKTGKPTRSEMTDAAMAERAECVMLNKGAFVLEGVKKLASLLTRMQAHQSKKVSRLRALRTW